MNTSDDDQKTTSSDTPLQKQSASEEAKDAIINVLRDAGVQDAIYIVQSINDFLRNVGREASRKRQQQYVEPFKVMILMSRILITQ